MCLSTRCECGRKEKPAIIVFSHSSVSVSEHIHVHSYAINRSQYNKHQIKAIIWAMSCCLRSHRSHQSHHFNAADEFRISSISNRISTILYLFIYIYINTYSYLYDIE